MNSQKRGAEPGQKCLAFLLVSKPVRGADLAGKGVGSGAVGRDSSSEERPGQGRRACVWACL